MTAADNKTPKADPVDQTIKQEISRFGIADSAIAAFEEQFGSLVITDLDDKEQYDKVHEARMMMRDKRIEIEDKQIVRYEVDYRPFLLSHLPDSSPTNTASG